MRNKTVKWIFFDVGSTLVDETAAVEKRIETMLSGSGIDRSEYEKKRVEFAKLGSSADKRTAEFFSLTKTRWPKELERPYKNAAKTLKELKRRGYKLGIIANQGRGLVLRLFKWGLLRYFKPIASSSSAGVSKPDERLFVYALKKAGCDAKNAVMVGDRLDNDIIPAKKLGMRTVWIKKGLSVYQTPKTEAETPEITIDDIEELLKYFL